MIRLLRGTVYEIQADYVVIEAQGVGYKVFTTGRAKNLLRTGAEAILQTHLHVREDEMTLYGFLKAEELQLFEDLIAVSGVGPRMALGVVSALTPSEFHRAVLFEDVRSLTRIPGIGKKTAHRMMLELRDRLGVSLPGGDPVGITASDAMGEAMEALVSLGYDRLAAGRVLQEAMGQDGGDTAEGLLKLALKALGRTARPKGGVPLD
ncbi:MAG: Holliday junction branch migration protein RuvA [Bacillota bacterium]